MALAHKSNELGKVNGKIQQTECTFAPDGSWTFDVWTPSGQYRTTLIPNRAENEESIDAWGRATWVDCRHLFHKVTGG